MHDIQQLVRQLLAPAGVGGEATLTPHYQPILHHAIGAVSAVEVLIRVRCGDRAVLGPEGLIRMAEAMGVMPQLDFSVMQMAIGALAESGWPGDMFINIAPGTLLASDLMPRLAGLLDDHSIEPERIVLELTEREAIEDMVAVARVVDPLRHSGLRFAVDDFGSGYSSYHYLKRLPISVLKIEGDFVASMLEDYQSRVLVRHMAELAHDLGLECVAEYIENEAVHREIQALGISHGQGFHIGRPVPRIEEALDQVDGEGTSDQEIKK